MSLDLDDANRFARFAAVWRELEMTFEAKVAEQKQREMEQAVEDGQEDEDTAKQKALKAKSAWKITNKVWSGHNCRRLMKPGHHEGYVWDSASHWKLPSFCNTYDFVIPYLEPWGFVTDDVDVWPNAGATTGPIFDISLDEGSHEEHGGHTWYLLSCSIKGLPGTSLLLQPGDEDPENESPDPNQLSWRSPRRLSQLRLDLHDPIKELLQERYSVHFADAPFARHGAPPGTTARLAAWLARLAALVNNRTLSPLLVARTLVFCHGPPLTDPHTEQANDDIGALRASAGAEAAVGEQDILANDVPDTQSQAGSACSSNSERPGEASMPTVAGEVEIPPTASMSQTLASPLTGLTGAPVLAHPPPTSAATAVSPQLLGLDHHDLLGLDGSGPAVVPATPGSRFADGALTKSEAEAEAGANAEADMMEGEAAGEDINEGGFNEGGVNEGGGDEWGPGLGQADRELEVELEAEAEAEADGEGTGMDWEGVGDPGQEGAPMDLDDQADKYVVDPPDLADNGLKLNSPAGQSAVYL